MHASALLVHQRTAEFCCEPISTRINNVSDQLLTNTKRYETMRDVKSPKFIEQASTYDQGRID